MKKILSLSIALFFLFSSFPHFSQAREVVIRNAQGEIVNGEAITENEATIDNFEDGNLKNLLTGESGAWNIDPNNEDTSCEPEAVDTTSSSGKSTKALKLAYDVQSAHTGAKLGFWTKLKNLDATKYDHLEFDVKLDPEKGGTSTFEVEVKKFKDEKRIEKLRGAYVVTGAIKQWQHFSIPLHVMNGITEWKDLDEFVVVFQDRRVDQKEGAILIDNIKFTKTGNPGPNVSDPVEIPGKSTFPKLEAEDWAKFLAKRLQGFPKKVVVKKKFPEDDRAFLMEIAKDTWKYFDNFVDREHQLPLDAVQFSDEKKTVFGPGGYVGDYTNVTDIGLYLMCLVSAQDLGFITQEEAVKRLQATLSTVEKLDSYQGQLYNYYDTSVAQRSSNFISFVDTGWLVAGLYVVKNTYPEKLGKTCEKLLARFNFKFYYDDVNEQMYHGFFTNIKAYSNYHYGAFYTEPRASSYIAIGRGDVPLAHWFRLDRTLPENYAWQTQEPKHRVPKTTLGVTYEGGYYESQDRKFVPSWGGSLFEALMPTLILNEKELAPESLGLNDKMHVLSHIDYATKELGYPVWGMSPCSVPEGGYSEYGVKPLGLYGYKPGVVTPHVSFLSLDFASEEVVKNLRKMLELYDIYGEYGFYDAVTVATGKVAYRYLCLDQAMSFIALNNYLNHGIIRKRFHQDPINEKAVKLLTEEKLFEP